jgi:uncharacterized membrane protein YhaH (DUF805 family)
MNDRLLDVASGRTAPRSGWFEGRANRKEYWLWAAPVLVVGLALTALVSPLFAYVQSIAFTCLWIRRFHDLGRTGWWVAAINVGVNAITFAGVFVGSQDLLSAAGGFVYLAAIAIMGALPGQPEANEYGPPPGRKGASMAETFS